jgi:Arc/MetJ-type ribon-helix-helix transcriptional regulator
MTKTFNISFPQELADQIDKKAKEQYGSRSDFLRFAAVKLLREEREFEELMRYGKTVGRSSKLGSEEAVAKYITNERRKRSAWRPKPE